MFKDLLIQIAGRGASSFYFSVSIILMFLEPLHLAPFQCYIQ